MKKFVNFLLLLLVLNLYSYPLQAQTVQIQINDSIRLNSDLTGQAVYAPLTLQTWEPPKEYTPVTTSGGPAPSSVASGSGISLAPIVAVATSVPVVLAGSILTIFLTRRKKHLLLPPLANVPNTTMDPSVLQPDIYSFDFGEKVTYNILLENSKQTPIRPDSILYIKIPDWLSYENNTTTVNETLMTDKNDKDIETYLPKDSIIIIHIGKAQKIDSIAVSFVVKVLKTSVSTNESFCLVKLRNPSEKYETDWQPVSSLGRSPSTDEARTSLDNQK